MRTVVIVALILSVIGAAGPSLATNKKLSTYNPPPAPTPTVCYETDKSGKKVEAPCPATP